MINEVYKTIFKDEDKRWIERNRDENLVKGSQLFSSSMYYPLVSSQWLRRAALKSSEWAGWPLVALRFTLFYQIISRATLWGVISTIMLLQTIRGRNWYFLVVPISGLVEMGGYIGRRYAAENLCSLPLYILSTLLTLVPPTCLAMGNYTLLAKIVRSTGYVNPRFTPGRVKWMFLVADCFCLFLQSSGGGLTASQSSFNIGKSIILIGIVAVLCVFVFFLFLVFYVQAAVYKNHKQDIRKWWPIFAAFCILSLLSFFLSSPIFSCHISMVMIIIRSCYRVAEFAGDLHNPIALSEPTFYACDCLPLLIFMLIWILAHPSRINFETLNGTLTSVCCLLPEVEFIPMGTPLKSKVIPSTPTYMA